MKWIASFFLIALLSLVAELYLPFWSIALVSFGVVAAIPQSPGRAFLCGFAAVFLLWSCLAFYMDTENNQLLSSRISLLILKVKSPFALIAVTGFLGGIVGGAGALSASFLRSPEGSLDKKIGLEQDN